MNSQKIRYTLTHPQQRVWYTEKLHPGTGMWNNSGTLKIKGELNYALLEQAINLFIKENESIRLRIGLDNGTPYQYVQEYKPYSIDVMDFCDRGVNKLYEWDSIQTQTPMPIIDSNLYYFALFKLSDEEGGLYANFHHIISDALSIVEFSNSIMENYQNLINENKRPKTKPSSYIDFIHDEQEYLASKRFKYDQQYWNDRFSELPEPTVMKQKKTNYFSTKAKRKAYVIPSKTSTSIREYCLESGVSIFSLFLSALAIYINRITNKKDIIIGVPVANRTSLASKSAFGMFVSTVPLRIEIQDDLTFSKFAEVVSNEWFSALKHQRYPYDILMQDLRRKHKGLESLYDVTLSYQYGQFQKRAEKFTYEGRWHFNGYQATSLSIHVNDREADGKFIVDYDHQTPFFSEKEMEYIHAHLTNIILDMISSPDKKLYELELLSDEERGRVINRFNDTDRAYPQTETFVDLWYKRLKNSQDEQTAVINNKQAMACKELEEKSSALALHLKEKGVGADDIIGLLVSRTMDYPVGVLAILKAGAAFLPIDAELPHERISYMLKDSGAKILLVSPNLINKCPEENGLRIIKTDISLPVPEDTYIAPICKPDNLAYVIYTSGSTGQPKGVQIEHRSIVHFVYSLNDIWDFSPGARLLCAASISFDISVMELVLSLVSGAVFVLAQEHEVNIPRNMVSLIRSAGVNMLVVTPGRMELLLSDNQGASCLKDFREIGLGGDVLSEKLLGRVQQSTNARIINFYGPTEITVCATCTDVTNTKVPNIGRPMPNVKAYILDAHKNPVPIGIPGELYIGGKGVARGYINKPELNRERFIDNPFISGQKIYRTGDLTRWYPLGEIEFLGRIDKQVKIRGYRIELGEIENHLMRIPGVTACAVADREDAAGRKFLCAYLCGSPPKKSDIKAALVRELPGYMVPSYFVTVESLPFSASGKIDRSRLPDPSFGQEAINDDYVAPKTGTEQVLAEIWSSVLGVVNIGRDDSFFDIGGDSLRIVAVTAQALQKFHVNIMLEDIYRSPRLRDWAALIDKAEECAYQPILPAPVMKDYPVSSAQLRMWVLAQGQKESTAYNIPVTFELNGEVDTQKLQDAFRRLIERHESLRTSFVLRGGELRQKIHENVEFNIGHEQFDEKHLAGRLKELIVPFDMGTAPLMRSTLIKTGAKRHVLFLDMHHSISDKKSLEILMQELAGLYMGKIPAKSELEYKDYAIWQQGFLESETISMQREYWQSVFEGELPLLNLHTDMPRPAEQTFKGARLSFEIGQQMTDKLRLFAQQRGATLFMMVLAAYNVLLSKYTGQEDIIIGTPVSGRMRQEIEDVVGVFINTLPLRGYPKGDMSFSSFFDELSQNSVNAFAHADYPVERIIADLALPRDASRNPLFDTMLVQAKGTFELSLGDISCSHYPFDPGIAKLDLTLEAYESDDGLKCQFEYNTRLFAESTIKRMSTHLCRLFELLTDEPDTRICDIAMMTQEEIWQVTQGFNQTDSPLDSDKSIQSLLEELAVSDGSRTALIIDGKKMSFGELNNRANQIAHRLREIGVTRNTIVALCLRRSFDMMAGLMGILKAGGGYLPLDPAYPAERISFMLTDSGTMVLLTDGTSDVSFEGDVLNVNDIPHFGYSENLPAVEGMEDAAYVIYTSGSTGIPKGAILPRRALLNLYEGTKRTIAYDKKETSVSVTTVSFDIFVIDALLPMLFGATVAICTEEELRQPHLLAKLIESADVKFIQTTPTRMRIMMENAAFRAAAAKHIKKVVLGGEEFPLSLLKLLKKHLSARIISGYGPTETTVYCTFKDLSDTSHITIGRPIINTRMYILDKYKRPVPIGVLGEAYISGACVATEYINRAKLNREKFTPDPYWPGQTMYQSGDICAFMENGEMEIAGRVDHQVKIRGLRIELGEIEAAMREVAGIEEAVVKDLDEGANKYLCAYYAMSSPVGQKDLRQHLSRKLPSYMVPSYFIGMNEMPMTLNGKVNRKALPLPDKEQVKAPPEDADFKFTELESRMKRVWSRILKIDDIRPEDSFFELGGDSFGVIKVQAAILQYGWTVRTQDFYDYQTLRGICERLNVEKSVQNKQDRLSSKLDIRVPFYEHLEKPNMKNIFLTGSTGYLGAHILEKLAKISDARIYCLVRGNDINGCKNYLRNVLSFYFGDNGRDNILGKVTVVKGNVGEIYLGMDETKYTQMLDVDTVIHCAAITDHVGKPEVFAQTNIVGTANVTELASAAKAALLHISTVSVSGTQYLDNVQRTGEFDENSYYIGQNYADNEYAKSKFLAEEIVLDAIEEGLNARIFRVGILTSTVDGKFQKRPEKNAFANRLKAICTIGVVPMSLLKARIEMTPVDFCAKAIIELASVEDPKQAIFHVYNTNTMTLADTVSLLEQNGKMIKIVSDQEFMEKIIRLSEDGKYAELSGIMEDLGEYRQIENIVITASSTKQLLSKKGFAWPKIDSGYMGRFINSIGDKKSEGRL